MSKSVNFAQARHNILAGNVANIDTPGYRMQDLSPEMFQNRLKSMLIHRNRDEMHCRLACRFASCRATAGKPDQHWVGDSSIADMLHHDDSNGSLEDQVTAIAKNELQHNTALAIMISQFQLLTAAISERA